MVHFSAPRASEIVPLRLAPWKISETTYARYRSLPQVDCRGAEQRQALRSLGPGGRPRQLARKAAASCAPDSSAFPTPQAYQDIRDVGDCSTCGSKHLGNGCLVSIDYYYGCDNRDPGPNRKNVTDLIKRTVEGDTTFLS